ncbi:MAG: hypothetical protein ABIA21_03885 [Candidatus Aenigmatarchaeota archaeon]
MKISPPNKLELDTSKVEFSITDIKAGIKIPKILSEELCYETGTHIGDGHISYYSEHNKKYT